MHSAIEHSVNISVNNIALYKCGILLLLCHLTHEYSFVFVLIILLMKIIKNVAK